MRPLDKKCWFENLLILLSDDCLNGLAEGLDKLDDYEKLKNAVLKKVGLVRRP